MLQRLSLLQLMYIRQNMVFQHQFQADVLVCKGEICASLQVNILIITTCIFMF